ncbi:MAG: helix-turn-helix transcriptional regulator [Chlorobiaceae bacterium]|nr:helix-turn-helix transcriptional regulator [Chlorobiaceae bacterium]
MPLSGPYTDEAKRLRAEIKKKFKTQVALCQAIGAKDASYITAYVTGKNRIGNILREKLEAVGIDVNYILYGKKGTPQLPPPPPDPILTLILTDCTQKIQQLQNQAIDMNKQLLELNKLLDTIKKRLP